MCLKSKYFGVSANSNDESHLIDVPIGENSEQLKYSRCTEINSNGEPVPTCLDPQESRSLMKILEYGTYKNKPATKVLLQALTGRRHQLRIHMKHLGHPIVGDMCYGIDDFDTYRTMLHAYKLKIQIDTGERMFIKAKADDPFVNEVDPDWKTEKVLNQLEKLKI